MSDSATVPGTRPSSDLDRIRWATTDLAVEIPSWGFVNTGTRFRVFPQPGVPRDPFEKIEDAATVARYTGIAKTVALHIPWDAVDDYTGLASFAAERGIRIGGINSNTFQDEDYKLGSLCHPDARVRRKAIDAIVGCCEIARQTGSDIVKVWLSDGTNYPGQDDFRARRRRLIDALAEVYAALPESARMVLEYKFYEPAFYHTDVQDWGQSLSVCQHLGERAQVCVDTGHHAMGVNIEQIVAILLRGLPGWTPPPGCWPSWGRCSGGSRWLGFGERLPFRDGSFDLAITVATLHHITDPGRIAETIAEMCRVTRPGGHVVVWDHNPYNPYWPLLMKARPPGHRRGAGPGAPGGGGG